MKKYIKPTLNVIRVELTNSLLGVSNVVFDGSNGNKLTDSNEILTHEDNGWDIWSDD